MHDRGGKPPKKRKKKMKMISLQRVNKQKRFKVLLLFAEGIFEGKKLTLGKQVELSILGRNEEGIFRENMSRALFLSWHQAVSRSLVRRMRIRRNKNRKYFPNNVKESKRFRLTQFPSFKPFWSSLSKNGNWASRDKGMFGLFSEKRDRPCRIAHSVLSHSVKKWRASLCNQCVVDSCNCNHTDNVSRDIPRIDRCSSSIFYGPKIDGGRVNKWVASIVVRSVSVSSIVDPMQR